MISLCDMQWFRGMMIITRACKPQSPKWSSQILLPPHELLFAETHSNGTRICQVNSDPRRFFFSNNSNDILLLVHRLQTKLFLDTVYSSCYYSLWVLTFLSNRTSKTSAHNSKHPMLVQGVSSWALYNPTLAERPNQMDSTIHRITLSESLTATSTKK